MRQRVTTALELSGLALTVTGCALLALWLAFVVAGLGLMLLGYLEGEE